MAKNKSSNNNNTKKSNPKAKKTSPTASKKSSSTSKKALSTPKNYNILGWLLAILGAALYFNTLGHQYAFDDYIVITGNSFTQQGFSGIYDLWTRDFFEGIYGPQGMDLTGGRYRPLSLIMFAIEEQLSPGNPFLGHFMNILLYSLTGMMLFKVLNNWLDKIDGGVVIAFITTLLFIAHPIHTEVVANIKSRDEVLAFLLILVTLHGIYKAVREENTTWLIIALVSFFFSMLSKENAFTYVVLIPLSLFVLQKMSLEKAIKFSVPFFVVAIAYLAFRTGMLYKEAIPDMPIPKENPDIMENPFVNADLATKLATIGVILLHYVLLLFVPHPMSSDYSFNQIPWTTFADPIALLGWGIYIGIGLYAAIRIWKKDVIALGILLYLAPLSLVTNLIFNIGAPMADRFLYVPSFGFCLIIAYLIVKYGKVYTFSQLKKKLPILAGLVVVTLLFAGKTIARNPDWYNNEKLFAKDVNSSPNSAKIHYYHANSLLKKFLDESLDVKNPSANDLLILNEADIHFSKSYEINPKFHHTTYNLGLVNIHKKKPQDALKWLKYTLKLQPLHGKSHEQLVRVYGEFLNQPKKALEHLNIVLSTPEGQRHASNYQHLGILSAMKGNITEAESAFIKAATMDATIAKSCYANLAGMYGNMANVAKNQGDATKAQVYGEKAQLYTQKANQ
jgi:hypothetical protein